MHKVAALAAFTLLFAAAPALAGWQEFASAFDRDRLARLPEARAKALSEAEAGAPQADLAVIHALMSAPAQAASAEALTGTYRCRTIKLGGITPDVIYAWFRCRISERGGMLVLQKLSGSQRTNGTLYADGDGSLVYLGASSVTGEPAHRYSGNGASVGASATPDDQIGRLTRIGEGHLRLEMPFPLQESTLDVLELER